MSAEAEPVVDQIDEEARNVAVEMVEYWRNEKAMSAAHYSKLISGKYHRNCMLTFDELILFVEDAYREMHQLPTRKGKWKTKPFNLKLVSSD